MATIGSTTIYIQELSREDTQIIARLNVLGGGTVEQVYGYEDGIVQTTGIVIGDTDRDAIVAMSKSGSTVNFSMIGTVYVSKVSWQRSPAIWQTVRQPCTDPVYVMNLELLT